jgi:hypothetical protein
MADMASLQQRLAELEQKKRGIINKEQQLRSQISAEKRKKENHCKMVLGGAVYGFVKDELPDDRKDLELYGYALKATIEAAGPDFLQVILSRYNELKAKQAEAATDTDER